MKVVNVLGGLGNQMFQYAFAKSLQCAYPNEEVKIDTHAFNGYGLHNGFELDRIFNIDMPKVTLRELLKIGYPTINYRVWQILKHLSFSRKKIYRENVGMVYQSDALRNTNAVYYDGYWQTEKYFSENRETILNTFTFPTITDKKNLELMSKIEKINSVSIHVRRGDYLNTKTFGGLCTEEYYKDAISYLKEKMKIDVFVVFSNDIEWCKENLIKDFGDVDSIFVDWNKGENSFRDMQIMSNCKHNIVANSSFSWWGAWLNPNDDKIVVAPKKWKNVDFKLDIIPDSWIKL